MTLTYLVLVALLRPPDNVGAFQFYQHLIPNGANCKVHGHAWPAVGHMLPDSMLPKVPRNQFASDFAANGYVWTRALCLADSDADGWSNGEELGDPNCTWRAGLPDPPWHHDGSHPGIDERHIPVLPRASNQLEMLLSPEVAPDWSWGRWFNSLPKQGFVALRHSWDNPNRYAYLVWFILFPSLVLLAVWARDVHTPIRMWRVLGCWLLLYAGIAVGYHRLFSHHAYVPTRPLKLLIAVLGVLTGQGDARYWAIVHRQHHAQCDGPADPHSPESDRGFSFAHGGFLYDHKYRFYFQNAPDLAPEIDEPLDWLGRNATILCLAVPLTAANLIFALHLLRSASPAASTSASASAATIREAARRALTSVGFYYFLPALMAWHNSMYAVTTGLEQG